MAANVGGDATAEDGVCRWTLLEDNKTLIRVGLNPRDVDTVGLSRSSERYIETILATVVNSVVLRAVATPAASPRRGRSRPATARSIKAVRRPGLKNAIPTIERQAKRGCVDDGQLQLLETRRRRSDPA